jgi:hypothetical protein
MVGAATGSAPAAAAGLTGAGLSAAAPAAVAVASDLVGEPPGGVCWLLCWGLTCFRRILEGCFGTGAAAADAAAEAVIGLRACCCCCSATVFLSGRLPSCSKQASRRQRSVLRSCCGRLTERGANPQHSSSNCRSHQDAARPQLTLISSNTSNCFNSSLSDAVRSPDIKGAAAETVHLERDQGDARTCTLVIRKRNKLHASGCSPSFIRLNLV